MCHAAPCLFDHFVVILIFFIKSAIQVFLLRASKTPSIKLIDILGTSPYMQGSVEFCCFFNQHVSFVRRKLASIWSDYVGIHSQRCRGCG
jgi:hypothetical protein